MIIMFKIFIRTVNIVMIIMFKIFNIVNQLLIVNYYDDHHNVHKTFPYSSAIIHYCLPFSDVTHSTAACLFCLLIKGEMSWDLEYPLATTSKESFENYIFRSSR